MKCVVTKFSLKKGLPFILCVILFCIWGLSFIFTKPFPGENLVGYVVRLGPHYGSLAVIGWVGCFFWLIRELVILYSYLFMNRNAIWTDNGYIYYMDILSGISFRKIDMKDIKSLRVEVQGRLKRRFVIVEKTEGDTIEIIAWIFDVPPEEIVSRLNNAVFS